MAIASWLPQTTLALRRLLQLLESFRGLIPLVLRRILGRLAFIWSILGTNLGFRRRGIGKPPSSSQDDESRITKARKHRTRSKYTEQAETSRLESGSTSYTLIEQGEIISLDDVAFSAYPFPGNIRATRSTQSLAKSHRSAQSLAITVNNASRSSQHLGSEHSYHSGNSNYSGSVNRHDRTTAAPYLHQPSRNFPGWQKTTPTPHRQHTISAPNLEVISPIEDMSPTGNGEVNSLRIPATRSATPEFMLLDDSRISPKMPEDFAVRRYRERPRM
jgi:hypothetical protein